MVPYRIYATATNVNRDKIRRLFYEYTDLYDVVVNIALAKRTDTSFDFSRADVEVLGESDHLDIDYAADFTNLPPGSTSTGRFQLLKLHGSFNWVMSALSGNLYFGGFQKLLITNIYEHILASLKNL